MLDQLSRLLFLLILVCSFPSGAQAQECRSPVAALEAAIVHPGNAAQIKQVDRLETRAQIEIYLAALGADLDRGEEALVFVHLGEEVLVFGVKTGCVIGTGKLEPNTHRTVMDLVLGRPA